MKKLFLVALAICAAPICALAQTSTNLTFSGGATVNDASGNCLQQGVTSVQVSGSTIILQGGNASCGTTTTPPVPLAVSVTFPAATYTSGSPTVSWSSTPATTCSVTQTGPATLSQQSSGTAVTFAAPTANGAYNFTISCALPSGYTSINWSPGNSSSMQVGGVAPSAQCDSTQKSDYLGQTQLTRQCTGQVSYQGQQTTFITKATYTGNLWDLSTILSGGISRSFMGFLSGSSLIFTVNSGSYVALAFTPTESGSLNFAANSTYGHGGIISLSTRPGGLVLGQPGVICSQDGGGGNGLNLDTLDINPNTTCPITVGTTYYINFADVDYNGVQYCFNSNSGTCTTSKIAYNEYVSRH